MTTSYYECVKSGKMTDINVLVWVDDTHQNSFVSKIQVFKKTYVVHDKSPYDYIWSEYLKALSIVQVVSKLPIDILDLCPPASICLEFINTFGTAGLPGMPIIQTDMTPNANARLII
jgi:hypothetical protein